MNNPTDDPDAFLRKELEGVEKNFSYWHRLASEGLVFVATSPDARSPARLDLAAECERRAKEAAISDLQRDLADGLLAAVERMHARLEVMRNRSRR